MHLKRAPTMTISTFLIQRPDHVTHLLHSRVFPFPANHTPGDEEACKLLDANHISRNS